MPLGTFLRPVINKLDDVAPSMLRGARAPKPVIHEAPVAPKPVGHAPEPVKPVGTNAVHNAEGRLVSVTARDGKLINSAALKGDTELAASVVTKNSTILSKMKTLAAKNPGTTLAGALAATIGVAGLASAYDSFIKNNNVKLTITSSLSGPNPGDVIINYNPSTTIVDGDNITIVGSNFVLNDGTSLNGKQFPVSSIKSDTSVIINIPNIKLYATSGTLTLQTTYSNRIWSTVQKGVDTVESAATNVSSGVLSTVSKMLSPYMKYIQIFCCIFCYLIIFSIFWKIYSLFR